MPVYHGLAASSFVVRFWSAVSQLQRVQVEASEGETQPFGRVWIDRTRTRVHAVQGDSPFENIIRFFADVKLLLDSWLNRLAELLPGMKSTDMCRGTDSSVLVCTCSRFKLYSLWLRMRSWPEAVEFLFMGMQALAKHVSSWTFKTCS